MIRDTHNSSNTITFLSVLNFLLFLFILPGIIAGLGAVVIVYFDGLKGLPPVALKLAVASAGMMVVSYIICRYLRANREFIKLPLVLTSIGIVLLPLSDGILRFFNEPYQENIHQEVDLIAKLQKSLEGIVEGIMFIAPATLCAISIIILAFNLTSVVRAKQKPNV
ncbi:hypothetical protein R6G55_004520 [Salmonella enterica]|nr:hypothetical protein [Salmonella enterica]